MRFAFRYWCVDHFNLLCPVNVRSTMPDPESTKSRLKDKYHRPNKLKLKRGKKIVEEIDMNIFKY